MQTGEELKSDTQINKRYARQTALPVIGLKGQERLLSTTLLIIGCGALGSVQAELAARAGIGRIIIADRDIPEIHNLQRQTLFDERDVLDRIPKAEAAVRRLRAINSEIVVEPVITDVTRENILDLVAQADIVLDGTDNFETRYLINDACVSKGKPWVYGGTLGTRGLVLSVRPGAGPCLRCVFPDPPSSGPHPTCETDGVLNTAVMIAASLQVNMAFKTLLCEETAVDYLWRFDLWQSEVKHSLISRDQNCVCCGLRNFEYLNAARGASSIVFCGRNGVQITPDHPVISDLKQLAEKLSVVGTVSSNGLVLECIVDHRRLVIFPDGRVLVLGTTDPSEARSLAARILGI